MGSGNHEITSADSGEEFDLVIGSQSTSTNVNEKCVFAKQIVLEGAETMTSLAAFSTKSTNLNKYNTGKRKRKSSTGESTNKSSTNTVHDMSSIKIIMGTLSLIAISALIVLGLWKGSKYMIKSIRSRNYELS